MIIAKDIMSRNVITVNMDCSVEELAGILAENRIGGAIVVNDDGKAEAVVTENDLIDQKKKLHIPTMISFLDSVITLKKGIDVEEEIRRITATVVRDICSHNLVSINEDTALDEIASIMADRRIHTLPVVNGDELVGVVGKTDVIRTLAAR